VFGGGGLWGGGWGVFGGGGGWERKKRRTFIKPNYSHVEKTRHENKVRAPKTSLHKRYYTFILPVRRRVNCLSSARGFERNLEGGFKETSLPIRDKEYEKNKLPGGVVKNG